MTQHCDKEQLRNLVNATATPRDDRVIGHLSDCKKCQRDLETIAAGEWWWTQTREFVAASEMIEMAESSVSSILATSMAEAQPPPQLGGWKIDFLDPPTQPDLLGRLGKYHIESVIGNGGMGIVLRGFDTELNRAVAIKVMAPHLATSGTARKRFAREARAAAAVVHDHVVAIYGIETTGDLPYLVMPYISGSSLQAYVERNGPFETKEVVRIAMQVAAGLAAAHEQGLVHRDIKPANIMLENDLGRVLITDFGLARAADDASITRSGLVAGTPHYMSPEQANGDAVDERSDLFSLGSVIYFMATGRAPFRGDGVMAVLHAICHRDAKPLQTVNSDAEKPLELLVGRLHSKQPSDRFDSASQLRQILADYLTYLQNPSHSRIPLELTDSHGLPRIALMACLCILLAISMRIAVDGWFDKPTQVTPTSTNAATDKLARPQLYIAGKWDREMDAFDQQLSALKKAWQVDPSVTGLTVDSWNALYDSIDDDLRQTEQAWSETTDSN